MFALGILLYYTLYLLASGLSLKPYRRSLMMEARIVDRAQAGQLQSPVPSPGVCVPCRQ